MNFQVLVNCMFEEANDIITRLNLSNVPTLVVNQCDISKDELKKIDDIHSIINTNTRGLSVGRNIGVRNASAKICLLSDNDELFIDDLEKTILKAYDHFKDADLIIFNMLNKPKKLGDVPRKLKKYELLKVSSWQISFRLDSVKKKIKFDRRLGAGTGNGASEENKFLLDCYKAKLKIYYYPAEIASVAQEQSTWFHGYDNKYFYNRGKTTRYILGYPVSLLYAFYFIITKRRLYKKDSSVIKATIAMMKGIFSNELK